MSPPFVCPLSTTERIIMSRCTRTFADNSTKSVLSVDYSTATPTGKAYRKTLGACTADRKDRQRAKSRSFVATTRFRAKLHDAKVLFIDDSWAVVRDGVIVVRCSNVTDAIAAL